MGSVKGDARLAVPLLMMIMISLSTPAYPIGGMLCGYKYKSSTSTDSVRRLLLGGCSLSSCFTLIVSYEENSQQFT